MFAGIVYAVVGIIEVLLGLRFVFRLLGANPNSGFVEFIYSLSTPLTAPFAGIFGQEATVTGEGVVTRSVFDWTALIALLIYGLIGVVLARALDSYGRR